MSDEKGITTTGGDQAIAKLGDERPAGSGKTFGEMLSGYGKEFARAAPKHLTVDRVFRLAQSMISRQPLLAKCSTSSLLQCLMEGTREGLEPIGRGGYWVIPFYNSKSKQYEATKVTDYRGLIDLVERSGRVRPATMDGYTIHEGDQFVVHDAGEFEHMPIYFKTVDGKLEPNERGKVVGVYAKVQLLDGRWRKTEPFTVAQINKYRDRSRSKDSGPWVTDWDAMAKKTAIRRLCNLLPQSPEVREVLDAIEREDVREFGDIIDSDAVEVASAQPEKSKVNERLRDALGAGSNGAAEDDSKQAAAAREQLVGMQDRLTELLDGDEKLATEIWYSESGPGQIDRIRKPDVLAAKMTTAKELIAKMELAKEVNDALYSLRERGQDVPPPLDKPWTIPIEKLTALAAEWSETKEEKKDLPKQGGLPLKRAEEVAWDDEA